MRTIITLVSFLVFSVYVQSSPARANLIQNGDFAAGPTDWSLAAYQMIPNGGQLDQVLVPNVSSGSIARSGFGTSFVANWWLDGQDLQYGTIAQTIATTPGHTYRIQYVFVVQFGCGTSEFCPNLTPGTFLAIFGSDEFLPTNTWIIGPGNSGTPAPPDALQTGVFMGADGALGYFPGIYVERFTDTATSDLTTLEFAESALQAGMGVTDVIVIDTSAVPEPSTIALFVPALLGFVAFRLKRGSTRFG